MQFLEADLVPLSALQHYMFCPRQCALIHLEQTWTENRFTAEGRLQHKRVDAGGTERRRDVKQVFGLPIRSLRLGLVGKADLVEFHLDPQGKWYPYPVEYKRGSWKEEDWDRVQLCAQALCLEEMLSIPISGGALFYERERRREIVSFETSLRRLTEEVATAVHELLRAGVTPMPSYQPRCDACSLYTGCIPRHVGAGGRVSRYYEHILKEP